MAGAPSIHPDGERVGVFPCQTPCLVCGALLRFEGVVRTTGRSLGQGNQSRWGSRGMEEDAYIGAHRVVADDLDAFAWAAHSGAALAVAHLASCS